MGWEHAASDIKEQIKEQKEDDFKDFPDEIKDQFRHLFE